MSTPVSLSRNRFYSFGALSADGFCASCDRPDGPGSGDFLDRLHDRFGKVPVFPDNASCHTSSDVRRKVRGFGGDVMPGHLLPHAPEPNPAGGQWRTARKATANTLYGDTDQMESIVRMMGNGEIRAAKMSGYLTV